MNLRGDGTGGRKTEGGPLSSLPLDHHRRPGSSGYIKLRASLFRLAS